MEYPIATSSGRYNDGVVGIPMWVCIDFSDGTGDAIASAGE